MKILSFSLLFFSLLLLNFCAIDASPFSNLFGASAKDNVRVIFLAGFESKQEQDEFFNQQSSSLVSVGLANGTRYKCHIPQRVSTDASDENWRRHLIKLQNRPLPEHFARRIHSALAELCFTYPKDWWTYRLCWNKSVRQFHADGNGKVEAEFFLGQGPDMKLKDGAMRELLYDVDPMDPTRARLVTEWFNGTECDITKREREMILYLTCPTTATSATTGSNKNGNGNNQQQQQPGRQGNGFTTVESGGNVNPYVHAQFLVEERAGTCVYEATLSHELFCSVPELRPRERPESIVRCVVDNDDNDEKQERTNPQIDIGNFEEEQQQQINKEKEESETILET
jgi:hypothetical protein